MFIQVVDGVVEVEAVHVDGDLLGFATCPKNRNPASRGRRGAWAYARSGYGLIFSRIIVVFQGVAFLASKQALFAEQGTLAIYNR